ncbi:MAG: hypothetical protein ABJG47_01545 [Ekhidna sp.]
MKSKLSFLTLLLIPCLSFTQSPAEDEIRFQAAVEWLENKLDYIYYDNAGEQWWTNTFYINKSNEITIKHIASDRPQTSNIKDKTYTIRKFRIQDINPSNLKVTEIKESRGRIVKGQMLELRTYDFQDLIHKSINNRKASSTSFLYLSFPETLIDSLSNYAEIVKSKFEDAISASIQIYSSDKNKNIETVFQVLLGSYQSINGTKWESENIKPHVLKVDRGNGKIEYFGYNAEDSNFYLLSISEEGLKISDFSILEGERIKLLSQPKSDSIQIDTPHSFKMGGQTFFRQ